MTIDEGKTRLSWDFFKIKNNIKNTYFTLFYFLYLSKLNISQ
jgi:hypothetical protein